jgi:hypothetical protein
MTYTNLANAYLLSGDQGKAVEYLEQGRLVLEDVSNWEPRMVFYAESASVWLALGNSQRALQSISTLEEVAGQLRFGPHWGAFERLKAFRATYLGGAASALAGARAARDRFKGRTVLYYVSVNAAVAWLEEKLDGRIGAETDEGLHLLDTLGLLGIKTVLKMEGFIH